MYGRRLSTDLVVEILAHTRVSHFDSPYGSALKALGFEMMLRGERKTAAEVYDALATSIDNVYHDIIHGTGYQGYGDSSGSGNIDEIAHPMEYWLFSNNFRVMDGPW